MRRGPGRWRSGRAWPGSLSAGADSRGVAEAGSRSTTPESNERAGDRPARNGVLERDQGLRRLRRRLGDGLTGADDARRPTLGLLRRQIPEHRLEALRVDRLFGDELLSQGNEPVPMRREDIRGALVRLVDDRADLLVDLARDVVAVVALLADLAAKEDEFVALPEGQRAELVAHPELRDHAPCEVGRLLDVVGGTGRGVTEDHPLGDVATEQTRDLVLEFRLRLEIAVLGRQGHRVTEGHAAADDGDLRDRVALGQDALDDGVTALVIGDDRLLGVRDDGGLALGAGDDPLQGFLELGHADDLLVPASREDRRLVDEVGEIRSGETRRLARDAFDVDALVERLALGVDLEDLDATLHVGPVEDDLAVEAARPQEGRVEDVGTVRGRDDDHVGVRVEAIHLDQDLVEGLLPLVVAAAEAGAALAADRVDLVDEDDARRIALRLVEQVAHSAGADADEHLDELRAGDREERHTGLTGHGPRHQRLAGTRRADEQHAARDARAERVELLGKLQELDDFLELGLGLVDARDISERDHGLVAEEHP